MAEQSASEMLAVIMSELAALRSIPADVTNMAIRLSEVGAGVGALNDKVENVEEKVSAVENDVLTLRDNTISLAARLTALETAKPAPSSTASTATASSVHAPRVTRRRINEVGSSASPPVQMHGPEDEATRTMLKLTGLPFNYSRDERLKVANRVIAELEAADINVPKYSLRTYGKYGREMTFVFADVDTMELFYGDVTALTAPKFYEETKDTGIDAGKLWWSKYRTGLAYARAKAAGKMTSLLHKAGLHTPSCDRGSGHVYLGRDILVTFRMSNDAGFVATPIFNDEVAETHGADCSCLMIDFVKIMGYE